jgi:hypothetical protein
MIGCAAAAVVEESMRKSLIGFVTATALAVLVPSFLSEAQGADHDRSPSTAAIAPANTSFGELRTIYIASGVTDDGDIVAGVATVFLCTNVSGTLATVRFLLLHANGAFASEDTVSVPHRVTYTVVTHSTALFDLESGLPGRPTIQQGVVNIESDQSAVFCSAMIVDASSRGPRGNALHLTRVNAEPQTVNRTSSASVSFGQLRTIYIASGVRDTSEPPNIGVATSFLCTNVSGVPARVRYLVLGFSGNIVGNAQFSLTHGQTHTASTHDTVGFREDALLSPGHHIEGGVVNIESDQSGVFCSAMIVDATTTAPIGIPLHMTRVNADPGTVN